MSTLPIPQHVRNARWKELGEGETIAGHVVQLPTRGQYGATRLFLRTDGGEVVAIAAAARRGWATLERALTERGVRVGDLIAVTFGGWRQTADGERHYRHVELEVVGEEGR